MISESFNVNNLGFRDNCLCGCFQWCAVLHKSAWGNLDPASFISRPHRGWREFHSRTSPPPLPAPVGRNKTLGSRLYMSNKSPHCSQGFLLPVLLERVAEKPGNEVGQATETLLWNTGPDNPLVTFAYSMIILVNIYLIEDAFETALTRDVVALLIGNLRTVKLWKVWTQESFQK